MKQRDNQKARVYKAERILQDHKSSMKPMTIGECQKFVNRVLARKAIIKIYGPCCRIPTLAPPMNRAL